MKFQSPVLVVLGTALLTRGGANAFVPSSSFVTRPSSVVTTHDKSVSYTMPAAPASSTRNTALQMNLVDRFMRVAKANMNTVLMNLEGPEKIMNQAVEDMQVRKRFPLSNMFLCDFSETNRNYCFLWLFSSRVT